MREAHIALWTSCFFALDSSALFLTIRNHTDQSIKTAFGKNELPSWNDLEFFIEDRCVSRHRDGLQYYLESIGLSEYDPWSIVEKTKGVMAEDKQWLTITEVK